MAPIPFSEYVEEKDEVKYYMLLKETTYKLEELSDMLWMLDNKMMESWMYERRRKNE